MLVPFQAEATVISRTVLTMAAMLAMAMPASAAAEDPGSRVVAGCLIGTSAEHVADLAGALAASPYDSERNAYERGDHHTVVADVDDHPGEAIRTDVQVTGFTGWTLPEGRLEAVTETRREQRVSRGAPPSEPVTYVARTCRAEAATSSGTGAFEAFERTHAGAYGVFTGLGQRVISVFVDAPHRREVLLTLTFAGPPPGLPADAPEGGYVRLVISDAGRTMLPPPVPGMPSVTITRAALLAALDRPAQIAIAASDIERVR
jgi:hypothetical protein